MRLIALIWDNSVPLFPRLAALQQTCAGKAAEAQYWITLSADQWPDDMRLSDLEDRFTCTACGKRGADVRPEWHSVEANA
jgi:hypothetical protein